MASRVYFETDGFSVDALPRIGGCRIRIRARVGCSPAPQDYLWLIGGVSVMVEMRGSGLQTLGLANQTGVTVLDERHPRGSVEFSLDLTRGQLELLERQRAGRGLTLIFDPAIHAVSGDPNIMSLTTQERLPISSMEWAEILDQARFADAFALLIPLGDVQAPTRQAADEMRRARRALDEGRYDDSVSSARKVIEQLWRSPSGKSKAGRKGPERSKQDRIYATADALFDLCSAAHHADEHSIAIKWDRRDAVLVFIAVASLVSWHAEGESTAVGDNP